MNTTITWEPLFGYEGIYEITHEGAVKAVHRKIKDSLGRNQTVKEHVMTQFTDRRGGYQTVKLTKNRSYGSQYIHRLLAQTFIPNPLNKPVVNHLNGKKLDNSLENLEWATRSENHIHAIANKLAKIPSENRRKVINMCTGEVYPTIKATALALNIKYGELKLMLKQNTRTCLKLAA